MGSLERLPRAAPILLLPGVLTVYLAFNAGGYFAGSPGVAATIVIVALVLVVTLAHRPFEGVGVQAAVAGAGLALYAAWILVSSGWSDAPGRATLEFDRALLYLLAFVLLASIPRSERNLSWLVKGLAAAFVVICVSGLITRVAPDVWPIDPGIENDRLAYPLTYWNGLGLIATMGIALLLHLTCSEREGPVTRALAAACIPALAATLFLTLSRGSLAALAVALVAYLVLAWPRALISGLIATVPMAVVAFAAVYHADLLTTEHYTRAAAVDQGHHAAGRIVLCVIGAGAIRGLLLFLDARLERIELDRGARLGLRVGAVLVPLVVGLLVFVSLDGPSYVKDQYDRFVEGSAVTAKGSARGRLTDAGNNGRLQHWRVALDAYRANRFHGNGAGTYQELWARHRDNDLRVVDGHSLYVETLGELGWVGLLLIVATLLTVLVVLATRIRGPGAALNAAVFAVVLAWALHAGIDWDWEQPAVTLPVICLAGAGMAGLGRPYAWAPPRLARVVAGILLLLVTILPVRVALSQYHLNKAVAAIKRDDCKAAVDSGLSASSALSVRPEPWEVVGYCDARLHQGALAIAAFRRALAQDPDNWELHYGLALALGSDRKDPRKAMRAALRLNPRSPEAEAALRGFRGHDPVRWEGVARASRILIP